MCSFNRSVTSLVTKESRVMLLDSRYDCSDSMLLCGDAIWFPEAFVRRDMIVISDEIREGIAYDDYSHVERAGMVTMLTEARERGEEAQENAHDTCYRFSAAFFNLSNNSGRRSLSVGTNGSTDFRSA